MNNFINDIALGKIHDNIIADLQKNGAIFDSVTDTFEYTENSRILEDTGLIEVKKEKYNISIEDIHTTIGEVNSLVNDIYTLSNNNIKIANSTFPEIEDKVKELGCLDTFTKYYKTYPENYRHEYKAIPPTDVWNNLIVNTTEIKDNRYDDYTKLYNRIYRLINLVEINAPNIMITNEMKLVTKAFLNNKGFIELEKNNDLTNAKSDKALLEDELER